MCSNLNEYCKNPIPQVGIPLQILLNEKAAEMRTLKAEGSGPLPPPRHLPLIGLAGDGDNFPAKAREAAFERAFVEDAEEESEPVEAEIAGGKSIIFDLWRFKAGGGELFFDGVRIVQAVERGKNFAVRAA